MKNQEVLTDKDFSVIREIPVGKIKPDPNQPRKVFPEEDIEGMAKSIITEGVINAIEIDNDHMIVTGEKRWKAAKKAGLKTVPCKIIEISDDERYMRQVVENVHHNTMGDWDTAVAFDTLLRDFSPKEISREHISRSPQSGKTQERGVSWLADKIGKSVGHISEKLSYLGLPKPMREAIKKGKISGTYTRALVATPDKYKSRMQKKIIGKEFATRDAAVEVAGALRRRPDKAEEILSKDYSPYEKTQEVVEVISKVAPRVHDKLKQDSKAPTEIIDLVGKLISSLDEHPAESIGKYHLRRVLMNLSVLIDKIKKWRKDDKLGNTPKLEAKNK